MIWRILAYIVLGIIGYFTIRIVAMKLKNGASLNGVTWRMFYAAVLVDNVMQDYGSEAIITAGTDGKHMANSKHYSGNALDFRTWDIKGREGEVASKIRDTLGPDYDVVVEATHLHVEYDPKTA